MLFADFQFLFKPMTILKKLNHLLPEPLADKVQLSWSSVDTDASPSILSESELKRYKSFSSAERKKEFMAGRYLVKKMASGTGLDSDKLNINKDEEGKPVAKYQGKAYYLSISHSEGEIMCGLSADISIGVDIEPAGRQITTELRSRIMSDDELKTLQGVNTLRVWTMKEALLKLHGKKLDSSLRECVINPGDLDIYQAEVKKQVKAKVFSLKHENYWLAVAW